MPKRRKFSAIVENEDFGLYKAHRPAQAGLKIFKTLSRNLDISDFTFKIIEKATKKEYEYRGIREHLKKPILKIVRDIVFKINYKYKVYRIRYS